MGGILDYLSGVPSDSVTLSWGNIGDIFGSPFTQTTFEDLMRDFSGSGLRFDFLSIPMAMLINSLLEKEIGIWHISKPCPFLNLRKLLTSR